MAWLYRDLRGAGRVLGAQLARIELLRGSLVLALPPRGVPVAERVAAALGGDLDAIDAVREPSVRGRVVVLVAEGLATDVPMRSAVLAVRALGARTIVVAVPVASERAIESMTRIADHVLCPAVPDPFRSTDAWYRDGIAVGDAESRRLLDTAGPRIEQRGPS